MDLYTSILNVIDEMKVAVKGMQNWGIKKANAESEYKTILRQEVLKERDKGTAVGVISLTVYGHPDVAKMRLERDIAETMYEVSQEKINVSKLEARILENQLNREYGMEGKQL
jgi:hypothetical protein